MRYALIVLLMLLGSMTSAMAQISVGIGLPAANIGIDLPLYPELVQVPGYPVYYAPRLNSNYFFYDGMYWVYQDDNWYASSWYNGPWGLVDPWSVPPFILRVPVRYYRQPPLYFREWRADTPPRWGERWGHEWEQRRRGWDRWDRNAAPAPAPLPMYQRGYSGDRYPRDEQQRALHDQNYRYQPREAVVRQHYQEQEKHRAPARIPPGQQGEPQDRGQRPQDIPRFNPQAPQQSAPIAPRASPQRAGEGVLRPDPAQSAPEHRAPATQDQRRQPPPAPGQVREKDRDRTEERPQERVR